MMFLGSEKDLCKKVDDVYSHVRSFEVLEQIKHICYN
jgi:hypothetical protein